nr:hypothetical protein [Paraburkholderia sp. BL25I1N1]
MTDEQPAARLSGWAVDIVAAALEHELLGQPRDHSRQAVQTERIKRYMLDRLGDADLDIAGIASECHIAPRTIHRLSASEGTTAIRWLWQQRLAASYRALAKAAQNRSPKPPLISALAIFPISHAPSRKHLVLCLIVCCRDSTDSEGVLVAKAERDHCDA